MIRNIKVVALGIWIFLLDRWIGILRPLLRFVKAYDELRYQRYYKKP